ncbi:MAG: FAD-dependent oxidoreductase, partial [Armatimonadota bacterium]|nr:FAD-dependent oxidoreductase [Armatimonadota bacterium]
ISTKEFLGDETGCVCALRTTRVEMQMEGGKPVFVEIPGTEETWEADLVLLAMGFVGPEKSPMLSELGVQLDARGNVAAGADRQTSRPGVFAAGDMARGQSLIVWAIAEGRECAHHVDAYLMGHSDLPRPLKHGNHLRPFLLP